jgi:polar amino acid transport system substrate-binding protein
LKKKYFLFSLFFALSFLTYANQIKVVTRNLEPFSFIEENKRKGYAIELWEEIAKQLNVKYDLKIASTAKEIIHLVDNKSCDVGVGALSVTSDREEMVDFSQPFFESGFQILTLNEFDSDNSNIITEFLTSFINWKFLGSFLIIILSILIVSHIVWRYEHKKNPEMWPKNYKKGIWESFWWSISILLVGGADNKGPVSVGGRLIAIFWMILSIIFLSFVTASFTASLTLKSLKGEINGPNDLNGKTVATLNSSTAEEWLNNKGIIINSFDNVDDCIKALKQKKVQAIVYDSPILNYQLHKLEDNSLCIVGPIFNRHNYAFAIKEKSDLREQINRVLLLLNENGFCKDLKNKWFGNENI